VIAPEVGRRDDPDDPALAVQDGHGCDRLVIHW
jgi:hypothetical protein